MIGYRPSIRHKIQFGYYSGVIIIVGLVVLTLIELRYMEKKIMFGEVISELFDTTLEIRRFEKNFFLYRQDEDLQEATGYVARSLDILSENREEYGTLAVSQQLRTLERSLQDYDGLLKSVAAADRKNTGQMTAMEGRIREKGKEITTIAEEVRKIERERLRSTLVNTEWNLILSILFFSLAGIIIGRVISRTVVRPLKALEASMKRIADGKFETVPTPSKDIEIVSLADAFNKMLMELELRQRHIVQSEKLASLGTLLSGVAHELNNPLSEHIIVLSDPCRRDRGAGHRSTRRNSSPRSTSRPTGQGISSARSGIFPVPGIQERGTGHSGRSWRRRSSSSGDRYRQGSPSRWISRRNSPSPATSSGCSRHFSTSSRTASRRSRVTERSP
ncbi:MAG: HAMP domain-containing protein [Desulfobacterales bacterium]|nr:HAMP domain-containing protein [Desulfobacterales bacterium]